MIMELDGCEYVYLNEGFFSHVYVNYELGLVVKQFLAGKDDERFKDTFFSEVEAYEAIQHCSELREITPKFYGSGFECKYLNNNEGLYLPKINYRLEFINGDFSKVSNAVDEYRQLFLMNGIEYLEDCSVCISDDGAIKVIDFATKRFESYWP